MSFFPCQLQKGPRGQAEALANRELRIAFREPRCAFRSLKFSSTRVNLLNTMQKEEFLELLEKYRHELYRYVLRTAWDPRQADDIFASAVLAAFENRHKFIPGTNFRAWMYRILTNKCFVANRETKRAFEPLDGSDASFAALGQEPGYADILQNPAGFLEQCGDEVLLAYRRLSTAERACLLLRAAEKLSYKEIADTLEIPLGTVMTHLSRGRAKMRKDLLEYARNRGFARAHPRILERDATTRRSRPLESGS